MTHPAPARTLIPGLAIALGFSLLTTPVLADTAATASGVEASAQSTAAPEHEATGTIHYPVEDLSFGMEDLVFGSATEDGGVKEEGPKITLAGEVLFAPNKATLAQKAEQELKRMVSEVKTRDAQEITVVGHTDNVQGQAHNQKLSERRATTIGKALRKSLGQDVEITTSGKGPDEPIADNKTEAGRKLNRRVEVTVLK